MWMNRYDIDDAVIDTARHVDERPNTRKAALALYKLMEWTDNNSDGWPYWQKPSRAADRLMTLLHERTPHRVVWGREEPQDLTDAELKKALTPIKSFLTRYPNGNAAEVYQYLTDITA